MPKLSSYESAGELDGTEIVPVIKDGVNKTATAQDIANLSDGGGASPVKAYAGISSAGAIDAAYGSLGVDSVDHSGGTGLYVIDFTSAGFTKIPCISLCVIAIAELGSFASLYAVSTTQAAVQVTTHQGTLTNRGFTFMAVGE